MASPSTRNRRPTTDRYEDDDIVAIVSGILLLETSSSEEEQVVRIPRRPQRNFAVDGQGYTNFLLDGNENTIKDLLRVDKFTFRTLAHLLVDRGGIDWSRKRVSVEVSLAMFLFICGMNHRMRDTADRFQCSTDTVSKHFKYMLRGLCNIARLVIHPPDMDEVPPQIVNDNRYNPWFMNCIGAIDGTHVETLVPAGREDSYRCRKGTKTQNVMAACSFNGKFTFVYPGWEGSAHDSRVFVAAVTGERHHFPHPPANKYYLVDAGYTNTIGYLAPYRGQRYHKDDFNGPNTVYDSPMDLFNHRHAMLRNIIEKTFGVVKARFKVLKAMPMYKAARQPLVVIACCVVHNWIIMQRGWDDHFEQLLEVADDDQNHGHIGIPFDMSRAAIESMGEVRDGIAGPMWDAYLNSLG